MNPAPGRVTVAMARAVPSPSRAWDGGAALGRAFLLRHRDTVLCHVEVHAKAGEALRWRLGRYAEVALHWALLPHVDEVLAVVGGDRRAWNTLAAVVPAPVRAVQPIGQVHDLGALLALERERLPRPVGAVDVTWGRRSPRGAQRSLRLGSCVPGDPAFIRIHPVLDDDHVPDWFVGFVLFHELLHIVFPPGDGAGRRVLHPKALRVAERRHPQYTEAMAWEHAQLAWLLASASC